MCNSELIDGKVTAEQWPLQKAFAISRSKRTHASTVYIEITDGEYVGKGECQPNSRYAETAEAVVKSLEEIFPASIDSLEQYAENLASAAARNALDCAIWDFKAKKSGVSVLKTIGIGVMPTLSTYYTLSVASPEEMAQAAAEAVAKGCERLKLKLAGEGDDARLRAVRAAAPSASMIVDANEAWSVEDLKAYLPVLEETAIDMLEQPFPAGNDEALRDIKTKITICADESCHTASDLDDLMGKYDAVNIKLDKAGGLTPALELLGEAQKRDFKIMVGCMLGTSLAMAPAAVVAAQADFVDLDGALLLAEDRPYSIEFNGRFQMNGWNRELWG